MNFRQQLMAVLNGLLGIMAKGTLGTPRGGQGWCMTCSPVSTGQVLFKSAAVSNKGAAGFWAMFMDGIQDKPTMIPIYVPPNSSTALDWALCPRLMQNGIYCVASSSATTVTPITTQDAWFEVAYDLV
jgi:hypothetical protein